MVDACIHVPRVVRETDVCVVVAALFGIGDGKRVKLAFEDVGSRQVVRGQLVEFDGCFRVSDQ